MDTTLWLGNLSEWLGVIAVVMIAGVSPLLKKIKPIEFRFPRREGTYALSLFAVIFFIGFQYYSSDIFRFLREFSTAFPGGMLAEQMVLAVVCLIPFILALILRSQPVLSVGWQKENLRAGILVGVLAVVVTIFLRGKFLTLLKGVTPAETGLLPVWLILVFAEEIIFRGYIQLRFDSFIGKKWGWLAAAGLFMLWQLPGRLWLMPASQIWQPIAVASVQGLICGWMMKKTGSVVAPILYRAFSGWLALI